MPECLWKFRVKDFGPLTVGDRLPRHVALPRRPGGRRRSDWRTCMPGFNGFLDLPARALRSRAPRASRTSSTRVSTCATSRASSTRPATTSTSSSSAGARRTSPTTSRRRSRSTARSTRPSSAAARSSRPSSRAASSTSTGAGSTRTASRTSRSPTARSTSRASASSSSSPSSPQDFVVMSEVGSKDSEVVFAPYQWVEWMKEELEAGAWKVITEAPRGRHGRASSARPARCAPA